jgi:hypothetical protein
MTQRKKPQRARRGTTKDRVLQARIPEQLDDQLRVRAEQLGLSVSTIVRNALLHTFELVEGVVTDSAQIGRVLQGRGTAKPAAATALPAPDIAPAPTTPTIVGWQEAILNQNGICDTCNTMLPVGERAAVGLPIQARPTFLCLTCLAALSQSTSAPAVKEKSAAKAPARGKKPTA